VQSLFLNTAFFAPDVAYGARTLIVPRI